MQSSERQLRLGLDARDLGHSKTSSLPGGVPDERRLTDPRLTPYDQDRALAPAGSLKQPVNHIALGGPAQKRRRALDDAPVTAADVAEVERLADRGFQGGRQGQQRLGKLAHRSSGAGSFGWDLQ